MNLTFHHLLMKAEMVSLLLGTMFMLAGCQMASMTTKPPTSYQFKQIQNNAEENLSDKGLWKEQKRAGDKAAELKNWQEAAEFYNKALDTIDDSRATPTPPSSSEIKQLQNTAQQMQILAANVRTRSLKITLTCDNIFRESTRGVALDSNLIAVHFQLNQSSLDKTGERYIQHIADCLKQKQYTKLRLIGHTDASGSAEVNRRLSLKRAETLRRFFLSSGVSSEILVDGKGEDEPIQMEYDNTLDQKEIDALNRRVEIQKL